MADTAKYYLYKITFEEVPHFYIGSRKCPDNKTPETDSYLGSPNSRINKCYWRIYTPKKHIFCISLPELEALEMEKEMIAQNWKCRYCLNENVGGRPTAEACSRGGKTAQNRRKTDPELDQRLRESNVRGGREGGKKGAKALAERRKNNPDLDRKLREASARGAKAMSEVVRERRGIDPEFDLRLREACSRGIRTREDRRKIDPEYDKEFREARGRGGKALAERRKNDPVFDEEYRTKQSEGARGNKNVQKRIWITNGTLSQRIPRDGEIPEGFRPGRK